MLLVSSIFILLVNAVTYRRDKSLSFNRITIIVFLYSVILSFTSLLIKCLDTGIGIYGGLFHVTAITQSFVVFISLLAILILQLSSFYPRRVYNIPKFYIWKNSLQIKNIEKYDLVGEKVRIIEYPLVMLFVIIGAMCLMASSDLISMFLSIELQSYGLYILSTIYRNSEFSTSAGLTYFLLGGLSSCFILFGSTLLYVNTGVTYLDGIYLLYNMIDLNNNEIALSNIDTIKENSIKIQEINQSLNISLIILSVGYLFKVSAAPFHFWSPDVYDCLPTIVTTFVAIISKISIFIFIFEMIHYISNEKNEFAWTDVLIISSLLSLVLGTVVGLVQTRIKRLFAYSTISHVGFILLALTINSIDSIQAFLFYLIQYSLSNLNFFFILISMGYFLFYFNSHKQLKLTDEIHSPFQLIAQLKEFFDKNPLLSLCLAITLFSFAGIPPLIGFFAKQLVLTSALDKGYIFMALIAIITSVIGAAYYLNIIKVVFFDKDKFKIKSEFNNILNIDEWNWEKNKKESNKAKSIKTHNIFLSSSLSLTISVLTLIILLFMINTELLLRYTNILSIIIFNI